MNILIFLSYSLLVQAGDFRYQGVQAFNVPEINLSHLCSQHPNKCSDETRKAIEQIQLNCELEIQGADCEKLGKEHPEWAPLMRKCELETLCRQNEEYLDQQASACFRGYKSATIEMGISVRDAAYSLADYVDESWVKFKTGGKKEAFIKVCDKSLACKRNLVRKDPLYSKLSDERLSQMPASFLLEREERVQVTLAERKRKALEKKNNAEKSEDPTQLDIETKDKLSRLTAIAEEKIKEQYHRFVCYHPLAQQELRCYAIGNIVDPLSLVGYLAKLARSYKVVNSLKKMEEVKEKGEDAKETVEKVKDPVDVVNENERRMTSVEPPRQDLEQRRSSIGKTQAESEIKPVEFSTIPNVPKSVRMFEHTNIEGKKQFKYEYPVQTSSGEWIKASKEFQIDELTGAINANYPSGRKLFDKIMQEKAGQAHFAFLDVGSLGAVNKTFVAGKKAGDRYIKAVAESIMKKGEGKITLARLGGDEFGLIIDETDPQKVKNILEAIQKDLRENVSGDAHLVFREEKIARAKAYREDKELPKNRHPIDGENGIAKIRQDISIGSSQIGAEDRLDNVLTVAEDQAKDMKIQTTLAFGRSAKKYGSKAEPRSRPQSRFTAPVQLPAGSSSWKKARRNSSPNNLDNLRSLEFKSAKEIKRFKNDSLVSKVDETGETSYFLERYTTDPKTGKRVFVSYEIPTRGQTGMLDGIHPASKDLVVDHFTANADNVLVMPKLESLRLLNYFEDGTRAGDEMLATVSKIVQKNMRQNDLSFKLNGADFLWSLEKVGDKELKTLTSRITKELKNSPELHQILSRERKSIESKITRARKAKDQEAIKESEARLKELKNFDPELNFQFIKRQEVSEGENFDELMKKLDDKFTQGREAQ